MRHLPMRRREATALAMLIFAANSMTLLAQDSEGPSSPAGLSMLVLFLGIAAIAGVFVIRWTQSTPDDED